MRICLQCGNEVTGRGKYCSTACKQAAYRNRQAGASVTDVTADVTVDVTVTELNLLGLPDAQMQHVAGAQPGHTINTGRYKTAAELAEGEYNRVALPGDEDYQGVMLWLMA